MAQPLQFLAWLTFFWLAALIFCSVWSATARWLCEYRRYCRCIRELSGITDRELKDIGITRGDIERIARDNDEWIVAKKA